MQIYHEKNPLIFSKCCTILYLLGCREGDQKVTASTACQSDVSRVYAVMIRKASARERGKRFSKPVAVTARKCPSPLPHYALSNLRPYEFDEPLSAALTLLTLWGVPAN